VIELCEFDLEFCSARARNEIEAHFLRHTCRVSSKRPAKAATKLTSDKAVLPTDAGASYNPSYEDHQVCVACVILC
jgi:hypothetical protein